MRALKSIAVVLLLSSCSTLPSDKRLIRDFNEHRGEFETVREMALSEHGVERIAPTFIRYRGGSLSNSLSSYPDGDKIKRYIALFRAVGARGGIGMSDGRVYFYMYDSGLSGSGTSKGVVWTTGEPNNIVPNLDDVARSRSGSVLAWRKIDQGWYLEYEAD